MKYKVFDVIIVGTGAAGLFTALSLPTSLKVLLITKDKIENSDSYLAQGGISTLKDPDDFDCYFNDTLKAGHFENNKRSVSIMINDSPEIIKELINYGVRFDSINGSLDYTREGAHTINRILHHEDTTGKEITSMLISSVKNRHNITIWEYTTMIDLITYKNTCSGILVSDIDGKTYPIYSKATFLATGGIGGLFINSTNFSHITGDSFAIALKHDVELENINYIQIHPTTLYSRHSGRRFLISESVRGEGGILLNPDGERFIDELLPRDVVTDAINKEMKKFNSPYMYLSLRHMSETKIKNRFPNIYLNCLREGYNLAKDLVPITPAQHYLMGGIKVNTFCETSMNNLYAVGETSCNGVHGSNRLASNSLLESLVFARRGARKLSDKINDISIPTGDLSYEYNNELIEPSKRKEKYKTIIMNEIKRKDEQFYAKWCNNED